MNLYRERGGEPRGLGGIPEGMRATGRMIPTTGVGDSPPEIASEIASTSCPDDGVLMHEVDGGWRCPECGHFEASMHGPLPPEFDGPGIHGG